MPFPRFGRGWLSAVTSIFTKVWHDKIQHIRHGCGLNEPRSVQRSLEVAMARRRRRAADGLQRQTEINNERTRFLPVSTGYQIIAVIQTGVESYRWTD